jgi:hypothetical protein
MDLIGLIDSWGRDFPDRPAHISGRGAMTYSELLARSNAVALSSFGPSGRSTPIAVFGHKEHEMLVGLSAASSQVILHPAGFVSPGVEDRSIVEIPAQSRSSVQRSGNSRQPATTASARFSRDDLWYIIFTSGSTGDPKGVMITHGCLESFVSWTLEEQQFRVGQEVFLNQAPFSFDLSVMDLYSSLATGGTLFSITQDEIAAPRQLFERLGTSGITVWVSTPSFARMCLMQPTFNQAMLPAVRKFWFCGETLGRRYMGARRFPAAEVWNMDPQKPAPLHSDRLCVAGSPAASRRVSRAPTSRPTGQPGRPAGCGEIVCRACVGLGYFRRPISPTCFPEHAVSGVSHRRCQPFEETCSSLRVGWTSRSSSRIPDRARGYRIQSPQAWRHS